MRYGGDGADDVAMRVIADHLRAVTFLLADGVIPGNEGRGYVLRRILRRAVRHGMRLGFEEPFLHRLVPVLDEVMGGFYPELVALARGDGRPPCGREEEKFLATIAGGARQVQEAIERARREGGSTLAGAAAFQLYDTYGLPLEVIREIAEEERFAVDEAGFEAALEEQRQRSRDATGERAEGRGRAAQGSLAGGCRRASSSATTRSTRRRRRRPRRASAGRGRSRAPPSTLAAAIDAASSGVVVLDRRRSTPSRAARSATAAR